MNYNFNFFDGVYSLTDDNGKSVRIETIYEQVVKDIFGDNLKWVKAKCTGSLSCEQTVKYKVKQGYKRSISLYDYHPTRMIEFSRSIQTIVDECGKSIRFMESELGKTFMFNYNKFSVDLKFDEEKRMKELGKYASDTFNSELFVLKKELSNSKMREELQKKQLEQMNKDMISMKQSINRLTLNQIEKNIEVEIT